jgi:exodeoxyribonuclease VII large subunit
MIKGRVSVYEKNGTYQIYVEKMNEDGSDRFIERYKRLWIAEGKRYFDPPGKNNSVSAKRVAVVTSPTELRCGI